MLCKVARRHLLLVAAGALEVGHGALLSISRRDGNGSGAVLGGRVGRLVAVALLVGGGLLNGREGVPVDVVEGRVLEGEARAELFLLRGGSGGLERVRGVLREVAARAYYLGRDDRERVCGCGGRRGAVGGGRVQVLLLRAEKLLGAVGLQGNVVRDICEKVGEYRERLDQAGGAALVSAHREGRADRDIEVRGGEGMRA